MKEADERDRERAAGRVRGPLHGIPIALKDNIHTTNMPTSGGALAFDGFIPPYEATLTTNLTKAGAIIIAKAGMSELAGYVAGAPTSAPGDYNAVGGQGYNPYDPRRDPRPDTADGRPALNTGGSSSGIGTAANLWAANIGTETSGSILGPSNQTMLAAVKPTVGRVSRWGVIPITADQDTAGPMARTVTDAAILLGALEGTAPDPNDAATSRCTPPPSNDYTPFLKSDALRGARIGIPRAFYYDKVTAPGAKEPRGGLNPAQAKAMTEAIDVLKQQGAVIVDPADIPSVLETDPAKTIIEWNFCGGADRSARQGHAVHHGREVRHEARLQQVAGDARSDGAGQDAHGAARMESRASEGRRHPVRAVAARHLRRGGPREGPRALRGRQGARHAGVDDQRHRCRAEDVRARRDPVPGLERRRHFGAPRLPERDRARSRSCPTSRRRRFPLASTRSPGPTA